MHGKSADTFSIMQCPTEVNLLIADRVWTPKQQQALETYAMAEKQAYMDCLASRTPWDFKSKEVQAYFKAEQAAWEACNQTLKEGTTDF